MRGRSTSCTGTSGLAPMTAAVRPSSTTAAFTRSPTGCPPCVVATRSEPAGISTAPALNDFSAARTTRSFSRYRSVMRWVEPLCRHRDTSEAPEVTPAIDPASVAVFTGSTARSSIALSLMARTSVPVSSPIVQPLSS